MERTKLRRFEHRPVLSDEEFGRLFPTEVAATAVQLRAEIAKSLQAPDVANRLLPSDELIWLCDMVEIERDSLDWVEFFIEMESRFGHEILIHPYASLREWVYACAAIPKQEQS